MNVWKYLCGNHDYAKSKKEADFVLKKVRRPKIIFWRSDSDESNFAETVLNVIKCLKITYNKTTAHLPGADELIVIRLCLTWSKWAFQLHWVWRSVFSYSSIPLSVQSQFLRWLVQLLQLRLHDCTWARQTFPKNTTKNNNHNPFT